MKKYLFIILSLILSLAACGGADKEYKDRLKEAEKQLEEAQAETERLEGLTEQIDETTELIEEIQEEMGIEDDDEIEEVDLWDVESLSENEARELLEYAALGEGDSLTSLVIENGEIKAIVEIGDNEIFDDKSMLAEVIYASAGEELLQEDGWEVLTIEFVDVGKVSMSHDEKESNEYGDYFPIEEIMKQLENY